MWNSWLKLAPKCADPLSFFELYYEIQLIILPSSLQFSFLYFSSLFPFLFLLPQEASGLDRDDDPWQLSQAEGIPLAICFPNANKQNNEVSWFLFDWNYPVFFPVLIHSNFCWDLKTDIL